MGMHGKNDANSSLLGLAVSLEEEQVKTVTRTLLLDLLFWALYPPLEDLAMTGSTWKEEVALPHVDFSGPTRRGMLQQSQALVLRKPRECPDSASLAQARFHLDLSI